MATAAPPVPDSGRSSLPQGVGRLTPPWWLFIGVTAAVSLFGLGVYLYEVTNGMGVTGMRNLGTMGGVTWGLYVTLVVYFIGISFAGITVAALIRIFNLERIRALARPAEILTVVALIMGTIAIVADLGQPLRGIVNLLRYARPQSPFFGTFTLVIAGYLFVSLVYLYLGGRHDAALCAEVPSRLRWFHRFWAAGYGDTEAERERHRQTSFWLALAIIPLLVVAHSTLGFVFGLQVGRPGWYGTLQAPAFVILADVSGVGALILLAAIVKRIVHSQRRLSLEAFSWLGKVLMVLLAVYLYFMVVELLTLLYATPEVEKRLSDALLTGEYAWIYWGSVLLLVLPMIALVYEALTKRWSIGMLVAVGLAVNVAALGKRYLIVVPSQTHGQLLPYDVGSYTPTWVEFSIGLSLFALGALLIGLFMKAFPIVPMNRREEQEVTTHA